MSSPSTKAAERAGIAAPSQEHANAARVEP